MKLATAQEQSIYDLLTKKPLLSAKEIARQLNIFPQAAYRSCEQLERLRVIKRKTGYPAKFEVAPPQVALGWFLLEAQKGFSQVFGGQKTTNVQGPNVSFIESRGSMLEMTERDGLSAKSHMNFIVSDPEIPESITLSYRRIHARSTVSLRVLVQNRKSNSAKRGRTDTWQSIGADTRFISNMGIRLFVYDSKIVYFASYNQDRKNEAFGVRFDYAPLAALMDSFFEEQWVRAT